MIGLLIIVFGSISNYRRVAYLQNLNRIQKALVNIIMFIPLRNVYVVLGHLDIKIAI